MRVPRRTADLPWPVRTAEKGEPYLITGTTSNYDFFSITTAGTGGIHDVTIWRPHPVDSNWFFIGDYAQNNYHAPTGTSPLVQAINDDPSSPLIKPPKSFTQVWNDKGSGGRHDGSIWFPVPLDGYISIGFVGQMRYQAPTNIHYACLF